MYKNICPSPPPKCTQRSSQEKVDATHYCNKTVSACWDGVILPLCLTFLTLRMVQQALLNVSLSPICLVLLPFKPSKYKCTQGNNVVLSPMGTYISVGNKTVTNSETDERESHSQHWVLQKGNVYTVSWRTGANSLSNIDLGAREWVLQSSHGEKCLPPLSVCMVEPNFTSHWPSTHASSNKQSWARGCFLLSWCSPVKCVTECWVQHVPDTS